jgi:hypothetical protein
MRYHFEKIKLEILDKSKLVKKVRNAGKLSELSLRGF